MRTPSARTSMMMMMFARRGRARVEPVASARAKASANDHSHAPRTRSHATRRAVARARAPRRRRTIRATPSTDTETRAPPTRANRHPNKCTANAHGPVVETSEEYRVSLRARVFSAGPWSHAYCVRRTTMYTHDVCSTPHAWLRSVRRRRLFARHQSRRVASGIFSRVDIHRRRDTTTTEDDAERDGGGGGRG